MPVAEHEIVDGGVGLEVVLCIDHQAFIVLPGIRSFLAVLLTAVLRPVVAETDEPPRMDPFRHLPECVALEAGEHEPCLPVVVFFVKLVTVGDVKLLAA